MNTARLARELFWVGVGQASAVVGSIVGLRVLTGALIPAEFGTLALALTIATLLNLSVFAGPGAATLRFFGAAGETGDVAALMAAARRSIGRRAGIVGIGAVVVAGAMWVFIGAAWASLAIAAVTQSVFTSFCTVLDGAQNAARQRKVVAFHAGLAQWLRWIAAIALFPIFGQTGAVALWGYTLASVAVFCSQWLFFRFHLHHGALAPSTSERTKAWRSRIDAYALPYSLWGLPYWLHSSSERWALQRFSDVSTVGLYAVLAQLGFGVMTMFSSVVAQLVSPVLFKRAGDGQSPIRLRDAHRVNERILIGFLGVTAMATLIAAAAHQWIFALLVNPQFHTASPLLPLSVLSGGLYAAGQIAVLSISSGVTNTPLIAPKIGSAAIGFAITVAGAATWGLAGVVWANLISSSIYFMWAAAIAIAAHRRTRGAAHELTLGERELAT